jgi:type IV pilus assembly protein PilF
VRVAADVMQRSAALLAKTIWFLGIDRAERRRVNHAAVWAGRLPWFRRSITRRGTSTVIVACVLQLSLSCGFGVSADDINRSTKQYELAVGLQQEGNTPGAFKTLYKALDYDPDNAKAHLLLAELFLVTRDENPGRFDREAEDHFRKVLEIQAGENASTETLASEARNGLGVLYIHQGRLSEAVKELDSAVSDLFNRDAYMAWGNLGWAYLELHNYPKAIEALVRSVGLRRDFCVGHFRLGRAYLATREFAKAEQSFTSAIEADPRCEGFQDAWHLRGEARMNLGNREDARTDFERCVELQPKSEEGKACSRFLAATY